MAKNPNRHYRAHVHGTLTVADAAGGVGVIDAASATPTASEVAMSSYAELGPLETAQIRYRLDGTAPTTTVGHLLEIGERLILEDHDEVKRFLAIRTGGTSGTLPVTLFR